MKTGMHKIIIVTVVILLINVKLNAQSTGTRVLDSVTVVSGGVITNTRKQPVSVVVIDAKKYYTRTNNLSDIINTASGVRVRQEGGLGSRAEVSLNGISGKQVKYFLDGIPLEYLGAASALNSIPSAMIDRIEIYKGVVPVELGTDALGGAIQLVSRKDLRQYLDAAYEFSSFNTNKLNLNGRYTWRDKYYVSIGSFYNSSDNHYSVDVEIPNSLGNPVAAMVKRFHDRFNSFRAGTEIGVLNNKWADQLAVGFALSGLYKNLQHNIVMTQPYGKAQFDETSLNTYLKWSTKKLFPNITSQVFLGYNRNNTHFLDTSFNAYTWDGKIANRRSSGGEISASRNDLSLHADNMIGRWNMGWAKDSITSVNWNVLYTAYQRSGHDPVATAFYGKDFYSYPTRLNKLTTGIAYQRFFSSAHITSITSIKLFSFKANGFSIVNNDLQPARQGFTRLGVSQALKWQSGSVLARASYEYASRLPDEYELFGDFAFVRSNPLLIPEISHNVNAGIQWGNEKWSASVGGFYRFVDNIIYLKTSQFFSQYQNLLRAQITGVETEFSFKPFAALQLTVNATYQDIINKTSPANSGSPDSKYYNQRLPNIPYFFGNTEIFYSKPVGKKGNGKLQVWYSAAYVHAFYLYWASDGRPDLKVIIPTQYIQNTGTSYTWKKGKYTLSGEVHNLFNGKAFDNFSVQRPGRSFHIKFRFSIHSHS